ncbi:MAG TPA: O-antigen ligase family protein [Vicinamibacterales bacterium]|nr:O-antigen ligase family protein [Vicinamibacterales bacterium]
MGLFTVSRIVVLGSTLLAVAAGLRPLTLMPGVLAGVAVILLATAALAWRNPGLAAPVVLLFAYTNYGVGRLLVGAELAAMPFWLAAFIGLAVGGGSWTRWEAAGGWRAPLAWWATGVAITWPFFAARDLGYSLAPSIAAGPIVAAAATQMSLALWMDHLMAGPSESARDASPPTSGTGWAWALAASAALTASAAIYQRLVDPTWLSGEPWTSLHRSVGLMGDANPTGVATALWAPLAWVLLAGGIVGTLAGGAAAALMWVGAWMSGARTTIILVAAGVCGLTLVAAGARGVSRRIVVGAALAAGLGVGILAVFAVPRVTPQSPVGRLVAAIPTASTGAAAYELLWRRDGYGLAAVEAIREHPVVGVGVGRFTALSTGYYQRLTGRVIPPDNAQNLWRHTFAEQGLLGLLPLLWLTALTIRTLVSRAATGMGLMARVMLAGIGVALVFGYPVQDAAIAATVATLTAAVERDRRSFLAPRA